MEKRIAFPLTAASLLAAVAIGQTVTGSIVGSVAAWSGLPVATAAVKLVHAATGASRATVTDERGDFVFASLTPGEYDLTISAPGCKKAERKQVMLSAADRLPVGLVTLEVGTLSECVTAFFHGAFGTSHA